MQIFFTSITVTSSLSLSLHYYHWLLFIISWFLTCAWLFLGFYLLILRYSNEHKLFWYIILLDLINELVHSRLDIFVRKKCRYLNVLDANSIKDSLFSSLLHQLSFFLSISLRLDSILDIANRLHVCIWLALVEKFGMLVIVPTR